MSEKPTYELKGTLREDCMKDTATLEDFRALESDWQELFRWLMSVSGDLPFRDADGNGNDRLSCLWKDHVLVVLMVPPKNSEVLSNQVFRSFSIYRKPRSYL